MKEKDIINEQMKTISNLQEEKRLLQFDNSENYKKIKRLEMILRNRDESIKKAKKELMVMKNKNDFSDINHVVSLLKGSTDYEE